MSTFASLSPYLGPRGAELRLAVADAVKYASARQSSDGAWRIAPEPRVLENALVVHCLRRAGVATKVADLSRAVDWLNEHPPAMAGSPTVATLMERWLWEMATTGHAVELNLDHPDFERPQLARRRLLFGALAVESGLTDDVRGIEKALEANLAHANTAKPWSAAEDASLYLILNRGQGASRDLAIEVIVRAQSPNGSVANNPISTVLALWAATHAGATTMAAACLDYLASVRIDGTWRFCTTEIWDTALLSRSLIAGGLGHDLVQAARSYLVANQNADGGWAYAEGRDSDVDSTAMALTVLDLGDREPLARGQAYLVSRRDAAGLWPTWNDKRDPVADDVVAHAVAALMHIGAPASEYERGQEWLGKRFEEGAGWRADWYDNRYYTAYEIGMAVRRQHPHTRRLAAELIEDQNSDGGFSPSSKAASSAAATGCALALLGEYVGPDHPSFLRALDWLLAVRAVDGTWPGPTGMYGPRPFVSDYAIQTHALALLGVSSVLRKLVRGQIDQRRNRRAATSPLDPQALL